MIQPTSWDKKLQASNFVPPCCFDSGSISPQKADEGDRMHRVLSVDGSRRKAVYVICVPHPLWGSRIHLVGSTNSTTPPVLCYLPGLPHAYWLIYSIPICQESLGMWGAGPSFLGTVCSPSPTRNIYLSLKSTETLIPFFTLCFGPPSQNDILAIQGN